MSMNLLGYHYTQPLELYLSNGHAIVQKGTKLKTVKKAFCQGALHYNRKQEPIPEGTEIIVNYTWCNFYGTYCTVTYNGEKYDLRLDDLAA